jgi:hypothetical protein
LDQKQKMNVVRMSKPIPDNETDRTAEAILLIKRITDDDIPKLTTWEMELVGSLREGRAATRIRLKELRAVLERLHPTT